jgi:hypothetical protein
MTAARLVAPIDSPTPSLMISRLSADSRPM